MGTLDDKLEWDLEERDRFMAEHSNDIEEIEPNVEVLVETDE